MAQSHVSGPSVQHSRRKKTSAERYQQRQRAFARHMGFACRMVSALQHRGSAPTRAFQDLVHAYSGGGYSQAQDTTTVKCRYFPNCRYGASCRFSHAIENWLPSQEDTSSTPPPEPAVPVSHPSSSGIERAEFFPMKRIVGKQSIVFPTAGSSHCVTSDAMHDPDVLAPQGTPSDAALLDLVVSVPTRVVEAHTPPEASYPDEQRVMGDAVFSGLSTTLDAPTSVAATSSDDKLDLVSSESTGVSKLEVAVIFRHQDDESLAIFNSDYSANDIAATGLDILGIHQEAHALTINGASLASLGICESSVIPDFAEWIGDQGFWFDDVQYVNIWHAVFEFSTPG